MRDAAKWDCFGDKSGVWSKEYQSWAGDEMAAGLTLFPYGCTLAPRPEVVHIEVRDMIKTMMSVLI